MAHPLHDLSRPGSGNFGSSGRGCIDPNGAGGFNVLLNCALQLIADSVESASYCIDCAKPAPTIPGTNPMPTHQQVF